jgi:hypothetical protein
MVALAHTFFTQHPKGNEMTLEQHLEEMGIRPKSIIRELEEILDPRLEYLAKGYFNDPRNGNNEVPF